MSIGMASRREKYEEYILSDHWKQLRIRAFMRVGNRCEACSQKGNLEGHHLLYRELYDCTEDDVMALCTVCHKAWHERHSSHIEATRHQVLTYLCARPQPIRVKTAPKPKMDNRAKQSAKQQRKNERRQRRAKSRQTWSVARKGLQALMKGHGYREELDAYIAKLQSIRHLYPAATAAK